MSRTNDVNIAMQYAKSGVDGVHLMDSHKATIGWVVNTLAAEIERLEDLHRMQLAGISTATLQNTVASSADRIPKDNPYWTIAYGDVCKAVDREIAQRVRAEAAEADSARHKRNEELQMERAIKAEARVKELEREAADSAEEWAFCGLGVGSAAAAAMKHMEILKKYREQSARLRAALESLQSDAQCTIDLYNKIGPTWTSRDSGAEYYDASYVIGSAEERIATIKAALADTKGTT